MVRSVLYCCGHAGGAEKVSLSCRWRSDLVSGSVDFASYEGGGSVAIGRLTQIADGGNTVVAYTYAGPGRVATRRYNKVSDGSTEVATLTVSYDGAFRMTKHAATKGGNTRTEFRYGYDAGDNPQYEHRVHQQDVSQNTVGDAYFWLSAVSCG